MSAAEFESFEEFWDFYVGEHRKKGTRILHFAGTSMAIACVAAARLTKRRWPLLAALVVGYGPAWFGHFVIEKNKPATFKYPLWSFQADLVMWWKTLRGEMQAEVDRVLRDQEERAREDAEAHASVQKDAIN